jgi:TonB family protein
VLHARNRPLPQLPKRARRADVTTGMAIVRLHVSATGSVDKVELVSAKPVQVYDDQVAATLMQWTFDPPGQATQTTVELEFKP